MAYEPVLDPRSHFSMAEGKSKKALSLDGAPIDFFGSCLTQVCLTVAPVDIITVICFLR